MEITHVNDHIGHMPCFRLSPALEKKMMQDAWKIRREYEQVIGA
jgi:hypothetical protein